MFRYVCPHCLRTFIDEEYSEDKRCWECSQQLEVIPKHPDFKEEESKDV